MACVLHVACHCVESLKSSLSTLRCPTGTGCKPPPWWFSATGDILDDGQKEEAMQLTRWTIVSALILAPSAFGQEAKKPDVLTPGVNGVISKELEKKIGVPTGPAPRLKNG